MKIYRLYIGKPLLALYLALPAVWALGAVIAIIAALAGKFGPNGPPGWLFVPILLFGLFYAYFFWRIPFKITCQDDDVIEFRSVFRRIVVSPIEIKSVRAKRYMPGFVDVVHRDGTIHLVSQIDGFHDFIWTIKQINPAITIKGC